MCRLPFDVGLLPFYSLLCILAVQHVTLDKSGVSHLLERICSYSDPNLLDLDTLHWLGLIFDFLLTDNTVNDCEPFCWSL